jgi:hypothetical protein
VRCSFAVLVSQSLTSYCRVSGDVELNIVLLRLVEYLGHTNPVICGLAYNEVWREKVGE